MKRTIAAVLLALAASAAFAGSFMLVEWEHTGTGWLCTYSDGSRTLTRFIPGGSFCPASL